MVNLSRAGREGRGMFPARARQGNRVDSRGEEGGEKRWKEVRVVTAGAMLVAATVVVEEKRSGSGNWTAWTGQKPTDGT